MGGVRRADGSMSAPIYPYSEWRHWPEEDIREWASEIAAAFSLANIKPPHWLAHCLRARVLGEHRPNRPPFRSDGRKRPRLHMRTPFSNATRPGPVDSGSQHR